MPGSISRLTPAQRPDGAESLSPTCSARNDRLHRMGPEPNLRRRLAAGKSAAAGGAQWWKRRTPVLTMAMPCSRHASSTASSKGPSRPAVRRKRTPEAAGHVDVVPVREEAVRARGRSPGRRRSSAAPPPRRSAPGAPAGGRPAPARPGRPGRAPRSRRSPCRGPVGAPRAGSARRAHAGAGAAARCAPWRSPAACSGCATAARRHADGLPARAQADGVGLRVFQRDQADGQVAHHAGRQPGAVERLRVEGAVVARLLQGHAEHGAALGGPAAGSRRRSPARGSRRPSWPTAPPAPPARNPAR